MLAATVCIYVGMCVRVEPVGYDGGACYLAEEGMLAELRSHAGPEGRGRALPGPGLAGPGRPRYASDGDILAPTLRPESGAFSGELC